MSEQSTESLVPSKQIFDLIHEAVIEGNPPKSLNRREGIVRLYVLVQRKWTELLQARVTDKSQYLEALNTEIEIQDEDAKRLQPVVAPCLHSVIGGMKFPTNFEGVKTEILTILGGLSEAAKICRSSADFQQPEEPQAVIDLRLRREESELRILKRARRSQLQESQSQMTDTSETQTVTSWTHEQNLAILEADRNYREASSIREDIGIYVYEQYNTRFPNNLRSCDGIGLQRRKLVNELRFNVASYKAELRGQMGEDNE